jgi:hypothetical protein
VSYKAHTRISAELNAIKRSRTARRSVDVFEGLSTDWHTWNRRHTVRATTLSLNSRYSRSTFGMLATKICAPGGRPDWRTDIAAANWARKSSTVVMVDIDGVQTSLAPRKIVT